MSDQTPEDQGDSKDSKPGSAPEGASDSNPDTSSKKQSDSQPDLPPIPAEALNPKNEEEATETVDVDSTVEPEENELSAPTKPAESAIPNVMDLKGDSEYTIIGGDGDEYGPRTVEDVHRWIRGGRADGNTLVREGNKGPWVPLKTIPRLAALLEGQAPATRRPGKATAIAVLTLLGGMISMAWVLVVGWAVFASFGLACCLIPGAVYTFTTGIYITVRGFQLLGNNSASILERTSTTASLLIGGILAVNMLGLILGIVIHVLLRSQEVEEYLEAHRQSKS